MSKNNLVAHISSNNLLDGRKNPVFQEALDRTKYMKNRKSVKSYFDAVRNMGRGYLSHIVERHGENVDFFIDKYKKSSILVKPKSLLNFDEVSKSVFFLFFLVFSLLIMFYPNGIPFLASLILSLCSLLGLGLCVCSIILDRANIKKLGYSPSVFDDIEAKAPVMAAITDKAVYFCKHDDKRSSLRYERYDFRSVSEISSYKNKDDKYLLEAIGFDGKTLFEISDPKNKNNPALFQELQSRMKHNISQEGV